MGGGGCGGVGVVVVVFPVDPFLKIAEELDVTVHRRRLIPDRRRILWNKISHLPIH